MRGHIKKRVEMRRLKRTRRIGSEGRLSPFPKQQNEQQQQKQVLTPKVKQYFGKIKIVKLAKKNLGVATKFYTKGFDRVLQKNNMCKISLTQLQNKLLYFFSRLLVKYRERVKNVYEKFYECTEEDIAALSIEHRTYTAEELDQQAKEAQEAAEEEAEEERVRAAEELAEFKRKLNQTIQKQKYLLTHKEETSITVTPGADVKIVTANSSNGCTYNTSTSAKVDSVTADGSINLLPATSTQAAAISIASSDDTVLNAQDSSLFGEFADVLQQTCASTDMHTENDDNIGEIATELAMQEVAADAVNAVIGADCSEIYSATKIPFLQFFTTNVRFGNSDLWDDNVFDLLTCAASKSQIRNAIRFTDYDDEQQYLTFKNALVYDIEEHDEELDINTYWYSPAIWRKYSGAGSAMHLLNFLNASSRTETDTSVADACSLYTAESYTEFENFFSVLLTLQKRKTSRTKLMRRRHRQLAAHFSFRTKRFRIPNLFTIVARAQRYTMLLKQSAERTVITNNAFEQILVPDQFYGATYKKYVHQNFFYEEGSKAFLFIVRHSSFCDKYFNKNVDFSFKSFFYFIDSDDTSEKKTPKQIIDAFFGKMPTLKITKTKNKLNICFGAAIKKWDAIVPASYTTKDFTILKFFEEINDLTRYSLIEFYKVFVLLILYKNK